MKELRTTWLLAAVMGATPQLLRAHGKSTRQGRSESGLLRCALTITSSPSLRSSLTVSNWQPHFDACSRYIFNVFSSTANLILRLMSCSKRLLVDKIGGWKTLSLVTYDIWCRPAVQRAGSSLPLTWTSPMAVIPRYNSRGAHASRTSYWLVKI